MMTHQIIQGRDGIRRRRREEGGAKAFLLWLDSPFGSDSTWGAFFLSFNPEGQVWAMPWTLPSPPNFSRYLKGCENRRVLKRQCQLAIDGFRMAKGTKSWVGLSIQGNLVSLDTADRGLPPHHFFFSFVRVGTVLVLGFFVCSITAQKWGSWCWYHEWISSFFWPWESGNIELNYK